MAMLSNRTVVPCSAHRRTMQIPVIAGNCMQRYVLHSGQLLPVSIMQTVASCNRRHVKLHYQTLQSAVFKRNMQTPAAAQETMVLDEPVIEFLGVNNGMQTVKGILHVAADADLVYNILTNYDDCAQVFRNIVASETILLADGGKQVLQACQWQVLGLKGAFNVHLNVEEDPASRSLVFRLHESSFMKDFEGRWQVQAAADGGCRIEHILAVKPVMEIPAAIAPYTSSIFKQQVGKLLQDLQHAIDRQLAATAAAN